jgi:Uma2 family endonuclease
VDNNWMFPSTGDVIERWEPTGEPDVLFVSKERIARLAENNVQGAPDLVVEILSPSTRRTDERIKLKRYEQFDVREYWIVDPDLEIVKVYRRGAKGLERVAELAQEAGDALTSPLLPGLAIPLAKIFE